jgi:hypothetical protein
MADNTTNTAIRRSTRTTTSPTSESKDAKRKKLIQLNLKTTPKTGKNADKSEKKSEQSPTGGPNDTGRPTCTTVEEIDMNSIHESLMEIKQNMVSKSDISEVVKTVLLEHKSEIVKELKTAIKDEIKKEIVNELKSELENSTEGFEEQVKRMNTVNSEKFDALNMDLTDVREKFAKERRQLEKLTEELHAVARNARQAISMANFNQQYSQKCNIKIHGWKEQTKENLREKFCSVLKQKVNIEVNPADILAIHRIPGNGGIRPVIVRMISADAKTNIMKHRKAMKEEFTMMDHITHQNAQLIQKLKDHPSVHSAWYYNSKVFAIDKNNRRRTFDVLDDLNKKLRE